MTAVIMLQCPTIDGTWPSQVFTTLALSLGRPGVQTASLIRVILVLSSSDKSALARFAEESAKTKTFSIVTCNIVRWFLRKFFLRLTQQLLTENSKFKPFYKLIEVIDCGIVEVGEHCHWFSATNCLPISVSIRAILCNDYVIPQSIGTKRD